MARHWDCRQDMISDLMRNDGSVVPFMLDIDCSIGYDCVAHAGGAMATMYCLTESRGARSGPYLLTHGRRFDTHELCWSQGRDVTPSEIVAMEDLHLSSQHWGAMLGNATSINVMERILLRGLVAVGFLEKSCAKRLDRWKNLDVVIRTPWAT